MSQATITKVSRHHFLYQSSTYAGDSGGALTLADGNVIGMHLEGINACRERRRTATTTSDKLKQCEDSIDGLIEGTAQGCLGLLSHVIVAILNKP